MQSLDNSYILGKRNEYTNRMEPIIKRLIKQCAQSGNNVRGNDTINDSYLERILISRPYTDEQLAKFFVFMCPSTYTGMNANVFAFYFKQSIMGQNIERLNDLILDPDRYYIEYNDNKLLSENEKSAIRQIELEELITMLNNFTRGIGDGGSVACLKSRPFFSNMRVIEDGIGITIQSDPINKHLVVIEDTSIDDQNKTSFTPGEDDVFGLEIMPGKGIEKIGRGSRTIIRFNELINLLATTGINPKTGESFKLSVLNTLRAKFLKEIKMYQRYMEFKKIQIQRDQAKSSYV